MKEYNLRAVVGDNGLGEIIGDNNGFSFFELVGVLEFEKARLTKDYLKKQAVLMKEPPSVEIIDETDRSK